MSDEAFNALGSGQLGTNKIVTSPTAQALYENAIGMFRGAINAPRIEPWAFQGTVTAGTSLRYQIPWTSTTDIPEYQGAFGVTIMATGSVTVRCTQARNSPGVCDMRLRRYRPSTQNYTTINEWSRDGASIEREDNVDVVYGDMIYIESKVASLVAGGWARVWGFEIRTGGEYPWFLPPGMGPFVAQPT